MTARSNTTRETRTSYSLAEAAQVLGVTDRTIRNYIARGRLPAYRVGDRLVRVMRADVEALFRPIPVVSKS
ncbi:MAG: helix-turn-helix domain-containing protein [Actinomycetota bacterium]|nr:helix-turn-helix domain-containing protein [Actinomycetota bacterium]